MKPGSVIVDMAAEQGGNCELTEPGKVVVKHGVTIIGYTDLPSRLAKQSSTLYATNLFRLTEDLCKTKDGGHQRQHGRRGHPRPDGDQGGQHHLAAAAAEAVRGAAGSGQAGGHAAPRRRRARRRRARRPRPRSTAIMFGVAALRVLVRRRATRRRPSSAHFTVFVLACFVGYMVVWNVTPALHTPLMSVTNAISSIIAIGALVQIAPPLAAGGATGRSAGSSGWRWPASRSPRSTCSAASPSPSACWRCSASRGDDSCPRLWQPSPTSARRSSSSSASAACPTRRRSRRGNLYGMIGMTIAVLATVFGPHVTAAGYSVDHRRDGGRRQHRPLRRARREDDADAGAGRADAQPGRPRRGAGRLRQLHRPGGVGGRSPAPRRPSTRSRSTSAS